MQLNRREMVQGGLTAAALVASGTVAHASALEGEAKAAGEKKGDAVSRFRYALNTATIRGHKLRLGAQFELAAKAGYDGVEPWIGDVEEYKKSGGSLLDLKKRIGDLGLTVDGAIGFANWIVDDDA